MTSVLDKLNLSPQEKRLVVVVLAVAVLVLSALFVWPRLGDWKKLQTSLVTSRKTLKAQQDEIARTQQYEEQIRKLAEQRSAVLPAEQALDLVTTVQNQAQSCEVAITRTQPGSGHNTSTNQFFDEQVVAVDVISDDEQLVHFLVALGSGDSMIRVRDMDLRPDAPQYRLMGKITLVASYQKKPKPQAATPKTAVPATASAKPPAAASVHTLSKPSPGQPTHPPTKL